VAQRQRGSQGVRPDEDRPRQFLEGFNIENFSMVGILSNREGMQALIHGAGSVHRVRVGDYLGRNHGRIVSIEEGRVDVVEIVPDGEGGWLERPRTLSLPERG
jgi:type IV pilus assembly protein PilP